MTIDQLRDKLVAAVVDNALPLTEAATGVAGIGKSIESQMGPALLAISGDAAPPSITIGADRTYVLAEGTARDGSGSATVLGIDNALLRCFFTLSGANADTVQFALAVTTPTAATPWTFGASFPPLKEDIVFSQLEIKGRPFFFTTSYVHDLTGYNPDVPAQKFTGLVTDALNVQAETNFGAPYRKLPGPLSTSNNLLFQGSASDRAIPVMLLIADSGKSFKFGDIVSIQNIRYYAESMLVNEEPVDDEPDGEEDFEEEEVDDRLLTSGLDDEEDGHIDDDEIDEEDLDDEIGEDGDNTQYSRPGILARVESLFGASPALELNSEVPTGGGLITLGGTFDEGHQPSLADMTGFLFGSSLWLPAPLQTIFSNLKLAGFGLQFDFKTTTLNSVQILSIYDAEIQVIPGTDYLTFSDLKMLWAINNPLSDPRVSLGIDGVVTVLGTRLSFTTALPAYVLSGGLDEDQTIVLDIPALLDHVGLPSNLLPKLEITEINFSAAPIQMAYALSATVSVADTWTLTLLTAQFGCTEFAFAVDYSFGVITGELSFKLTLQGFEFFVKGEYTGEEDGWIITGGLPEGETLPLVPFAASYLPFPVTVPESLAALSLTTLLVTFNTGPGTFNFLGAIEWPLDMFPGTPKITASVQIGNTLDAKTGKYTTSGKVEGMLEIYGLKISVSYTFKPDSTVIGFKLDYQGRTLTCGIETTPEKTVITAAIGNVTFNDILQFLVGLVLPGYQFELGSPWDILNKISFDGLTLRITRQKKGEKIVQTIGIEYPISINLGFFELKKIGLTVLDGSQGNTVKLDLYGTMLGTSFEEKPLSWDLLNDPPPSVPGQGDQLLDLRYLAIGQNVALRDARNFNTLDEALNSLKNFDPVSGNDTNPLASQNALVYTGDGSWLIGADFTVMGTVALGFIFNDPQLYGLKVALSGEKAKTLAGLSFEILYKKVTDTIGVYQIQLKLPDAIRQLQFGAVSLTIPIIDLAIYTNGNFRIDMGFPKNRDFSKSFCVQVFPFIGYGGFYFALLNGATSERVPKITNGTFSPVIEFGIGLSVGLGKTLDYGVLKAGLSLTVEGIIEGVLAWFNPTDTSQPSDVYFYLQGTVAIVGKLYGTVDFAIIKADVNVTASASITLTAIAFMPIEVYLELKVEVEISVKILFFTVDLSFSMTLDFSFTIGTASRPPWELDTNQPQPLAKLNARRHVIAGRRKLLAAMRREQRTFLLRAGSADGTFDWSPVPVFGGAKKTIPLTMVPNLTAALPAALHSARMANSLAAGAPQVEMVMSLFVENSAPPAQSVAHLVARRAPDQAPFNWLVTGVLLWSIGALERPDKEIITASDLEDILTQLDTPEAREQGFGYENLTAFIEKNYFLDLASAITGPTGLTGPRQSTLKRPPTMTTILPDSDKDIDGPVGLVGAARKFAAAAPRMQSSAPGATGATGPMSSATIFPMIPALVMAPQDRTTIDFSTWNPVSPEYQKNLDAYFQQLLVDYQSNVANDPFADPAPTPQLLRLEVAKESMATFIFRDYFRMLAKAGVQAAIDFMRQYPYAVAADDSLCSIAGHFGDTGSMCDPVAAAADPTAITVEAIGAANADRTLNTGAHLTVSGVSYQIQTDDSFATITGRLFLGKADLPAFFIDPEGNVSNTGLLRVGTTIRIPQGPNSPSKIHAAAIRWYRDQIVVLNPELVDNPPVPQETLVVPIATFEGGVPKDSGNTASYTVKENDTLDIIAQYVCMLQMKAAGLPWCTTRIAGGETIGYTIRTNDTFELISDLFCVEAADIALANFNDKLLFVPLAVMAIPDIEYAIRPNDTLATVAGYFNLTIDALSFGARFSQGIFPSGNGAIVVVPEVQELKVIDLAASLIENGNFDSVATMVSNFLLHGLRVPNPDDSGFLGLAASLLRSSASTPAELWGLYEIVGQQFTAPAPDTPSYNVEFTNGAAAPWVRFPAGSTALNVTLSSADIKANYPSTVLDPDIVKGPEALPLYRKVPERWSLQRGIQWQSASPVPLPTGATGATGPANGAGGPSIWLFPDSLANRLGSLGVTGPVRPYELVESRRTTGAGQNERTLDRYSWATAVELGIRRFTEEGGQSTGNAYLMLGADESGRTLLQKIWSFLNVNTAERAKLYILYAPNSTGANPTGLASDTVEPNKTFLLKTNLSSVTHSGPVFRATAGAALPASGDYFSLISASEAFVKYLWECSIVGTGGYYFNYLNSVGGTGLPDDLFSNGDDASIWLVAILDSQRDSRNPNRRVYPFNNCAVLGDQFDSTTANIFAQVKGATGAELMTVSTVPPGNVGFSMQRKNPDSIGATGPVGRTKALYNLLGYAVKENEFFTESNEALPLSPTVPDGATGATGSNIWDYQRIVPIAQFGRYNGIPGGVCQSGPVGATAFEPLPARGANPYAGITGPTPGGTGPASRATLAFAFHDIYGNQIEPSSKVGPISVVVGYTDSLIPLSAWPSAASEFLFTKGSAGVTGPNVKLSWLVNLQIDKYMPSQSADLASALYSASTDVQRYRQIYYQIAQRDLDFVLRTSLDQASETADPAPYPVAKLPLAAFAASSFVFLQTIQSLRQYSYVADGTETLGIIAKLFSVDPGALVEVNKDQSTKSLFAGEIVHPKLWVAGPNDSLGSIAHGQTGGTGEYTCPPPTGTLTPAILATNNQTKPLSAGVTIRTPKRPLDVPADIDPADNTLAAFAATGRCTVAYQYGDGSVAADQSGIVPANYDFESIVQPGIALVIEGVTVKTTETSTFERLHAAFVAAGLTISTVQFATAIQEVEGIIVPGTRLALNDYVIATGDTFASIAATYGTIDQLATPNADVENIFATGVPIYVNYTCEARQAVPIEEMLTSEWRISYAQFAEFNMASAIAAGATWAIPNLARFDDAAGDLFVPYEALPADTIGSIAKKFGIDAIQLARFDCAVPAIFAPTPITIGTCTVTPTSATTIGSLYEEFVACMPDLTFEVFIGKIAPMQNILAAGALLAPPLPEVPAASAQAGEGQSLRWLAEQFNVMAGNASGRTIHPTALALANSALDGLLRPGATVRASAAPLLGVPTLTVKEHDTFASLVYRFKTELGVETTVPNIAQGNETADGLLRATAKFILPPNPILMAQAITPRVPSTLFPITVSLQMRRSKGMVAPDFTGTPSVFDASSPIAPQAQPNLEGAQSFVAFAEKFEEAFRLELPSGTLRLKAATGKSENAVGQAALEKLWAVNFGSKGISRFAIARNLPGFYAMAPISTSLASQTVKVYEYVSGLGLTDVSVKTFQSVDLDLWMRDFLGTMDLFLTPAYSVPAFQLGSGATSVGSIPSLSTSVATNAGELDSAAPQDGPRGLVAGNASAARPRALTSAAGATGATGVPGRTSYEMIVNAKDRVADQLKNKVQPILDMSGGSDRYLADAQEALRQQMLIELSSAYAVDAVVRYPVDVRSSFTKPPAPRVSGPIVPKTFSVKSPSKLADAAALYGVSTPYFALGIVLEKEIVRPGISITYRSTSYCTKSGDTLFDIALALGVDPVIGGDAAWFEWTTFIAAIDVLHPVCVIPGNPEHPIILANSTFDLGRIARQVAGSDTIDTLASYLNVGVPDFARANQDLAGIFIAGSSIPYCTEVIDGKCTRQANYIVLPDETLAEIAKAINSKAAIPVTVESLALSLAGRARLMNPAVIVHGLQPKTENTFTTTKVDLQDGTMPPLITLFSIKQQSRQKKAFFELDYVVNEMEFDIADVKDIEEYQASSWLAFIIPIGSAGDTNPVVDTSIGQVEIPLPLRVYPAPPSMMQQLGFASMPDATTIADARRWTYEFTYETRNAAQDTTYLSVAFSGIPDDTGRVGGNVDPRLFSALAQFINVYPALMNDLALLPKLAPGAQSLTAQIAVQTLAMVAQQVASALEPNFKLFATPTVPPKQVYDFRVETAADAQRALLETLTLDLIKYTGPTGPATRTRIGETGPPGGWPDIFVKGLTGSGEGISDGFLPLKVAQQTATEASYTFPPDIAADASLTLMYSFAMRDIVMNQDGTAGVYLTRNQDLISSGPLGATGPLGPFPTNNAFVYRTPMVRFVDRTVPYIYNQNEFTIACVPAVTIAGAIADGQLAVCIGNLFDALLGSPSGSAVNGVYTISIAVSYGYTLAQPMTGALNSVGDIVARIPILFRPTFDYDSRTGFIAALTHAIESWTQANDPNPDGGFYLFDTTLYTRGTGRNGAGIADRTGAANPPP